MVMLDATYPATDKRRTTVSIHVVKKALKTGDYAIQGHEDRCLVERKGSAREIAKNTMHGKDRQRFERELVRLKEETAFPVLLMEGWPSQLLEEQESAVAVDALIRLLSMYGTELLLVPSNTLRQRRAAGEWVARLLINRATHDIPK